MIVRSLGYQRTRVRGLEKKKSEDYSVGPIRGDGYSDTFNIGTR